VNARILVVEDDAHLARGLQFNLEADGYDVEVHSTAESALERLAGGGPVVDLMLLDVMLPGMSGLAALRKLRSDGNVVPVLLLTARDSEQDIVDGLDTGADDYLTKPFKLPVLLARVRTLLRRAGLRDEDPARTAFSIGNVTIHPDRFELESDGETTSLTPKELGLLTMLHERRGSAVSRGEILQEVWDLHPETRTRVVDTFVLRLRKLIEPDPSKPRYLLSVRSFGYRLVEDPPFTEV
jgi:DNA-binding response OmpR family regulator